MRIIAGSLKGREFKSPHGHRTHPMSEKVRGALFNMLGDIDGLTFLDAFAGSGALAFEAVSRGAAFFRAIDSDKSAHRTLAENIKQLNLTDKIKATRANSSGWSDNNPDELFDIVFLAPPYDELQENLLYKLSRHVKSGGLLVLDWPGKLEPLAFKSFDTVADKSYGDAQLVFYRKIQ
ncbi:MAG TPA: RsmD family RNA methyltransferase [Candidatus Saccharimonadales bacterium]|nr:RsmD family RNA methyltransferase [Candidatus Saccharimonadales bacterium]